MRENVLDVMDRIGAGKLEKRESRNGENVATVEGKFADVIHS